MGSEEYLDKNRNPIENNKFYIRNGGRVVFVNELTREGGFAAIESPTSIHDNSRAYFITVGEASDTNL